MPLTAAFGPGAVKIGDGRCGGRNAHVFTGDSQDETPVQIGKDTDWQSVCSSRGGLYHLLKKRNGTFWSMDATQRNHGSVKQSKVDLPPNIVAWSAGGGAIGAITQDGEIWTCGTIFGQHGPKYRSLRFAEEICWHLRWKA